MYEIKMDNLEEKLKILKAKNKRRKFKSINTHRSSPQGTRDTKNYQRKRKLEGYNGKTVIVSSSKVIIDSVTWMWNNKKKARDYK